MLINQSVLATNSPCQLDVSGWDGHFLGGPLVAPDLSGSRRFLGFKKVDNHNGFVVGCPPPSAPFTQGLLQQALSYLAVFEFTLLLITILQLILSEGVNKVNCLLRAVSIPQPI